ncbi:MAG: CHRD domain-containing protein [Burkholderiales bacterium]
MHAMRNLVRQYSTAGMCAAAILLAGCAALGMGGGVKVSLSGAQEVPPVSTEALGSGTIKIGEDHSVCGSVTTSGVAGVAAHIHMGAMGKNGPVIVPLKKTGDNKWSVPEGAKLTDAQYAAYQAGDLYINVHSAAHKGGEIRGQLKP